MKSQISNRKSQITLGDNPLTNELDADCGLLIKS